MSFEGELLDISFMEMKIHVLPVTGTYHRYTEQRAPVYRLVDRASDFSLSN